MLDTATPILSTTLPPSAPRRGLGDISPRLAGAGAITFASIVTLQNIIRGGNAPVNGDSDESVLAHYADHRALTFVLVATFVVSAMGLAVFVGGATRRLLASDRRGWALTGFFGVATIMALFTVVVGAEQALSVIGTQDHPNLGAVSALFALHNSIFALLDVAIAVALLGLSRAGVSAGITPRVFERLAPVGSALLLVGAFGGPAIAAGDAMPLFGLAGLGFLVWLAFVFTTGIRLVRTEEV
jgi:cytochrome bd-type quinol oxidase subunit 2